MLFLPSHHCPQTHTKGPNLPVPLNLCFKMKDISNEGSFLIPLSAERGTESESEGGRKRGEKRSFRTSFSLPLSPTSLSSGLEPLVAGEGKFRKKFLEIFFVFVPFQSTCAIIPYFLGGVRKERAKRRGREQGGRKRKKNKKRGGTWLKERSRKRGPRRQLLERLVRDFQPLTSVAASSPT